MEPLKLPPQFVANGLEAAKGAMIFGVPLEELSHQELLAAAAMGWKAYQRQLDDSMQAADFLRGLGSANIA